MNNQNENPEKRLREVIRIYKGGFWRICKFGNEMASVIIKPRKGIIECYLGAEMVGIARGTDKPTLYADCAQLLNLDNCI